MMKVYLENLNGEEKLVAIKKYLDEVRKGTYQPIAFKSYKKVRKAYEKEYGRTEVIKVSSGVFRMGIDYGHTESGKNRVIDGTRPITDHFVKGYEHMLLEREVDGVKTYKLQIYIGKTPTRTKSVYYKNGVETPIEELADVICKESSGYTEVFTIHLDNLISIGAN